VNGNELRFVSAPDFSSPHGTLYSANVEAFDGANRTAQSLSVIVTHSTNNTPDTTPPSLSVSGETIVDKAGQDTVTLAGTVENAAGTNVHVFDGTTDLGAAALDGQGHWSFSQTFASGTHALHAVATDASGNATTSATQPGFGADNATFDFAFTAAGVSEHAGAVTIDGPDGSHTTLTGFGHYAFSDGTVNEADGSPLVDDLFYYDHNLDIWNAHVDADQHYAQYGWKEGRDPNALFSTSAYLGANQDVKAAGINPLQQYDQYGWHEGRDPGVNFDTTLYLQHNPDVKAAGIDPLAHYLQSGQAEGRETYTAIGSGNLINAQHGFDAEFYLLANADIAKAVPTGGDAYAFALQHYNQNGWHEGRNPNALFDTKGYLDAYGDVKAAGINPLQHYDQYGWKEGRDPSAGFDTNAYEAANPDVAAAHIDPLTHYLQYGIYEGRGAHADGHFA
jgi:hypothetical protein